MPDDLPSAADLSNRGHAAGENVIHRGGNGRCGGIILCGGQSRRMGASKAHLPFGEETLLARVVRLLHDVVRPVVVVSAAEQELPALPADVLFVCDQRPERGPLEGLAAGLTALEGRADAAYATSCDAPFLSPAFVQEMIRRLEGYDIAVPREHKFHHPLAAVYRVAVLPEVNKLLAADQLRPAFLFDAVRTHRAPVEELRRVDPELLSLLNMNHPQQYLDGLRSAGFAANEQTVQALKRQP